MHKRTVRDLAPNIGRTTTNLLITLIAFVFCTGFGTWERGFAPRAVLWERWTQNNPSSTARIDHDAWHRFVERYVISGSNGSTRVRYAAVSRSDKAALDGYVVSMASLAIGTYNRAEQLAFWINLYNALTIKVVLEHYPVASIRDIKTSPGFFQIGPWGKKLIEVDGREISLDDIEHRIVRPIWKDPKIHYALNCAAVGCPNLAPVAYTGATVDDRLIDGAIAFINSPRGVKITDNRVTVSRIYDWFHADFGGTDDAVLKHILRYAKQDLLVLLRTIGEIHDVAYDWRLNDAG